MKSSLCKQSSMLANINLSNKNAVRASFTLSEMIAKLSRPFTEGLFIKECLLKASDILCPNPVVLKLLKKFYYAVPFQFFQPLSVPCKFKHKFWLSCKDIYHKILYVFGKQLFILKRKK